MKVKTQVKLPGGLRLVDASPNRAAEGLRFLEDVARFVLDDQLMTERLKEMRHRLAPADQKFQRDLLNARDAEGDIGVKLQPAGRTQQHDFESSVVANSRRVQEALRLLAEYARVDLFHPALTPDLFEQMRFELYTIEKALLGRFLRKSRQEKLKGLYVVLDTGHWEAAICYRTAPGDQGRCDNS